MTARHEDQIQRAIVQALTLSLPLGWIVMAVPNKPRSRVAGAIEKSMGAKKGWPDLQIMGRLIGEDPADAAPFAGFLEVKTPAGRVRPEQRAVHDRLRDFGFPVAVVRSVEDALSTAREWGLPIKKVSVS